MGIGFGQGWADLQWRWALGHARRWSSATGPARLGNDGLRGAFETGDDRRQQPVNRFAGALEDGRRGGRVEAASPTDRAELVQERRPETDEQRQRVLERQP